MEKKSLPIRILNLLRDESAEDVPLTYEDIIDKLGTEQRINRKTVASNSDMLRELGCKIERTTVKTKQKWSFEKSKTGWYLASRDYTKDEVFVILNSIMETQNIYDVKIQRICRKILKNLCRADKEVYFYNDEDGKRLKSALDMNPCDIKIFEPKRHSPKSNKWLEEERKKWIKRNNKKIGLTKSI
jgi:hypothetical protein